MRAKAILLVFGVCIMALGGCVARHVDGSYVSDAPTPPVFVAMADDAAEQVAEVYAPGHTSVFIQEAPEIDFFYVLFERRIRAQGFALAPSKEQQGVITLTYTIDRLFEPKETEPKAFYLQLNMADPDGTVQCFARPYSAEPERLGCLTATSWEGKSPRFPAKDKKGRSKVSDLME